jgi:hypothetical protein
MNIGRRLRKFAREIGVWRTVSPAILGRPEQTYKIDVFSQDSMPC